MKMTTSVTGCPPFLSAKPAELSGLRLITGWWELMAGRPARRMRSGRSNGRVLTLRAVAFVLIGTGLGAPVTSVAGPESDPKTVVAVLDFELHDLTLTPGMAEEKERTASIAPLLREMLQTEHGFEIAAISSETQQAADEAFGYIFEHHDIAAELGREASSDLIVVGRVHKASFLFVYFKAKIIDTRTNRLLAELTVEVKGSQKRLTAKGVETLARQIAATIGATQS